MSSNPAHAPSSHTRRSGLLIAPLTFLGVIAVTSAARANLLINGGFEAPGGVYADIGPGTEPAGFGWTVVANNVETMGNAFWSPYP